MWSFYDELYIGIPSGILVEGCVVGDLWTTVRIDGNIGIATTMGAEGVDKAALAQSMIGEPLREVANVLKWDSLIRASVGVAALNAFYNKQDNLTGKSFSEDDIEDLTGKKIYVIGDMISSLEKYDCSVLDIPDSPELSPEYKEAMNADHVFISGDTLINRTLPELLTNAGNTTKVTLYGPSVPAAPVMFAFGNRVDELTGIYASFPDTVEAAAKLNIKDLDPGTKKFKVVPVKAAYLHESSETVRYRNSPYKAAAFNSAFNPWEGKEYEHSTWSDVFKG